MYHINVIINVIADFFTKKIYFTTKNFILMKNNTNKDT